MVKECVARGAAYLDKHYPGWLDKIDFKLLDLQQAHTCILGQLYGRFEWAPCIRQRAYGELAEAIVWACGHGFEGHLAEHRPLRNEWIRVIRLKRKQQCQRAIPTR